MRYTFFILLIIGISCRKSNISQNENIKIGGDTIQNNESGKIVKTEVEEALSTAVDTLTENEFTSLFKEKESIRYNLKADSKLLAKIDKIYSYWTNQKLLINDTLKSIYISGYPLNLKEQKNGKKWVTSLSDENNSIAVRLYTFDKYFNLIDNVRLTSVGGDQGYKDWSIGEFKNDSTYFVEEFLTGFNTDSIESITSYCLIIKSNGKIHRIENCR